MRSKDTAERVTLVRLPSGTEVRTVEHTYDGGVDGPTVYIQAAQHGREVNGTEVLRQLHDRIDPNKLRGRVITVPVADPITFDLGSYTTPEPIDYINDNMNRIWPGETSGTIHERMAAQLWKRAEEADVIIDLHTSQPDTLSHVVYTEADEASRSLAEVFGTELLLAEPAGEEASEEWYRRRFHSKLRVVAANRGITCITPELAYRRRISRAAVQTGVTGIENVLREVGVLDGTPKDISDPVVARNHLSNVIASESGFFIPRMDISLGKWVESGEDLGTLYDPVTYETLQDVKAEQTGILYGLLKEPKTMAGDTLAQIALPIEDVDSVNVESS